MNKVIISITLTAFFFSASLCLSEENKSKELFDKVFKDGRKCADSKISSDEKYLCLIKSTPKKCEREMINYLSVYRDEGLSDATKTKLFLCVATCAEASIYSRTFGECSRK